VHQIRNFLKYVSSKNQKEFMVDLKRVYKANNKGLAESELDMLEDKWNDKYPIVIKSWLNNWERRSQYLNIPKITLKKAIRLKRGCSAIGSQQGRDKSLRYIATGYWFCSPGLQP
jgi:transposase-like protein